MKDTRMEGNFKVIYGKVGPGNAKTLALWRQNGHGGGESLAPIVCMIALAASWKDMAPSS